jgi:predicted CXXCH cytochrome family protein
VKRFNYKLGIVLVIAVAAISVFIISCATIDSVVEIPFLIPGAKYVGNDTCAACHEKVVEDFKRTSHGMKLVKSGEDAKGCESCHGPGSLHVDAPADKTKILKGNPATCYTCHQRVRSEFTLQYRHPLPEGRMGCNDCHSIHGTVKTGIQQVSNETCLKCHQQIRGPWTFEHEPVAASVTTRMARSTRGCSWSAITIFASSATTAISIRASATTPIVGR